MPQIYIDRLHGLSFLQAQALAHAWAKAAQDDFGMQIEYVACALPPPGEDVLHFKRSGAHGSLRVTALSFVLEVQLGFLLGNFKDRIESALLSNLERHLAELETQKDSALVGALGPQV